MTGPPGGGTNDEHSLATALLAVIALALAASFAGIGNQFANDDIYLIEQNARIHDLGKWRVLFTSPFWPAPFSQDLYRPLTSLLLAIQFAFGGGDPVVFRVVSYLLYAGTAAGVVSLCARLVPRNIALGAALLFAVHPVHVEAVALGVGQSELAVALAALLMTTRYLDRRRADMLARRDWGILAALYAAASLLKEQGLVLPGLLLAVELFLVDGPARTKTRRVAAGYALLAFIGAMVLLLRHAVLGEVAGTFTAEALFGLGPVERALTMLRVVPEWARLLSWPAHLRADYSPRELMASSGFGFLEAFGLVLAIGALTAIWLARRRAPVVSFGLTWCIVTLLPVSNVLVPTGVLLAERTLFLPSIGFVVALAGVAEALWPRLTGVRLRRALAGTCGLLVAAGVVRSAERHRVWRNDPFLAVRSVQDAPRSFRTQRAYADVLFELQQPKLAREAYDRALALAPPGQTWRVRNDLARQYRLRGETQQELEQLRASLAQEPAQEDTRGYLIAAYLAVGKYTDAASEADFALARGASPQVFGGIRALADSAARVSAPAGSIRIGVVTGQSRPVRP